MTKSVAHSMRLSFVGVVLFVLSTAAPSCANVDFSRTVDIFNDGTFNLKFKSGECPTTKFKCVCVCVFANMLAL
jgi:hypothetical protein